MLPLLYQICGISSGAQLLNDFKGLSLGFSGDCAKCAANIEQYLKVLALQDICTNALCHIIDQAPAAMERLRDEQQRCLTLIAMDKATKDFTEGKIEKKAILAVFTSAMCEVDVTCRIDGPCGCQLVSADPCSGLSQQRRHIQQQRHCRLASERHLRCAGDPSSVR